MSDNVAMEILAALDRLTMEVRRLRQVQACILSNWPNETPRQPVLKGVLRMIPCSWGGTEEETP